MKKSPLMHALSATAYIALVVSLFYFGERFVPSEDNALMPIAMLSLLVLSVACMGFIFFFEPVHLYISGDTTGAVSFFLKTIGFFACITALIFLILFFVL